MNAISKKIPLFLAVAGLWILGCGFDNLEVETSAGIEGGPKPEARHQFSMYLTGKWRRLTAKDGTFAADDVIEALDVSILQNNLLAPVLGIKDPRTDERINFMGGIRGLDALATKVNEGAYSVAFAMYPTSMEELIKVADAGKIMPPKSTWFEPKLRDAMVVHLIGDDE